MRSPFRAKAPSYVLLASRIFQGATVTDLGRAAGAKSITFSSGAENWTLVNGTANFLSADPDGCYIDANGFNFKSGSSACSDDWGDGNILGPCLYKLVSEIVPSTLWASTSLGLNSLYSSIDLIWIVDASAANANTELLACGFGTTSAFGNGVAGRVGFAGSAAAAGSAAEASTYNANAVTTASFSFPGSGIPTAIRTRLTPGGMEVSFGTATGLTPPTAWYSRDALYMVSTTNNPNNTNNTFNKDMVAAIGLVDSNGGGAMIGTVKALYIYGQKIATTRSLTVGA